MHLKSTFRVQNVDKVLGINCKPTTHDDMSLFDEQKKFMLSFFERSLLTDQGKSTFRSHEIDYDNQEVCKDLIHYHTNSITASLTASSQLIFLTITAIDEWKSGDENFILHWRYVLRIMEATVSDNHKWVDKMKKHGRE